MAQPSRAAAALLPGAETWAAEAGLAGGRRVRFSPAATLERIFRERHGVVIPRQQMVQWVEGIAFLLPAVYHGIWEELQNPLRRSWCRLAEYISWLKITARARIYDSV